MSKSFELKGSAQDVAEQIFERVIAPVHRGMNAYNADQADDFAFCIAGMTVAGYLSASSDLDADKAKMLKYIEAMYEDIKNEATLAQKEKQQLC